MPSINTKGNERGRSLKSIIETTERPGKRKIPQTGREKAKVSLQGGSGGKKSGSRSRRKRGQKPLMKVSYDARENKSVRT